MYENSIDFTDRNIFFYLISSLFYVFMYYKRKINVISIDCFQNFPMNKEYSNEFDFCKNQSVLSRDVNELKRVLYGLKDVFCLFFFTKNIYIAHGDSHQSRVQTVILLT